MRLLLDSHTLIWSADRPDRITSAAMTAMGDPANELLVSAASLWEIAIKFGLGRLPLSLPYRQWMEKAMLDLGLLLLPITLDHAERQALLPWHHRDPFDPPKGRGKGPRMTQTDADEETGKKRSA